jgi:hypothetical protein
VLTAQSAADSSCSAPEHCSKIAEAEAVVSVNEKKWLVMHMHVQLKLDELRGPPNPWLAPEQRSQPLTAAVVYYSIVHACSTDGMIGFSPF